MVETTYRYIKGEDVVLDDGQDYTNAVLERCRLTYGGGAVRVEGALFRDCSIAFVGNAENMLQLDTAIRRSLYAEGYRALILEADGTYEAK